MQGRVDSAGVLKDAKNNNSPLHSFFEWDEGKAAEQYRLHQARGLIQSVVAIYTDGKNKAFRTKAYVHIAEATAPHYRETGHAMSQAKTRNMVLQRAWKELVAWRQRYQDLKQFSELFDVMNEVVKALPKDVTTH